MSFRTAFIVSAIALVAAFVVPVPFVYGAILLGRLLGLMEDWRAIGFGVVAMMGGVWIAGMCLGLAVFAPLSAWLHRLNPEALKTSRVLPILLVLWAPAAGWVPLWARARLEKANILKAPVDFAPCMRSQGLAEPALVTLADGRRAIRGTIHNQGTMHVDLLEVRFGISTVDTPPCLIIRQDPENGLPADPPLDPGTEREYTCPVDGAPDADARVRIKEVLRWGCTETGRQNWKRR